MKDCIEHHFVPLKGLARDMTIYYGDTMKKRSIYSYLQEFTLACNAIL